MSQIDMLPHFDHDPDPEPAISFSIRLILSAKQGSNPPTLRTLYHYTREAVDIPEEPWTEKSFSFRRLCRRRLENNFPFLDNYTENCILQVSNKVGVFRSSKILGGSSTTNAMNWVRGAKEDYDKWSEEGATGWSFDDVLPFFKKSEDIRVPELLDSPYRGRCGPMPITVSENSETAINELFLKGLSQFGIPLIRDQNGPNILGASFRQRNVASGQRVSASRGYLHPASGRPNLEIITDALVQKVIFSKRRAVGIEYFIGGRRHEVRAKREVIISAGTFRSPQILMLSGIGNPDHLRKFGIKSLVDLPVGDNLIDHLAFGLQFPADIPTANLGNLTDPKEVAKYLFRRKGHYADNLITQLQVVVKTKPEKPGSIPDFQLALADGLGGPNGTGALNEESFQREMPIESENGFSVRMTQLHPRSRGTIRLQSGSVFDFPVIDPKYLSNRDDIWEFIKGIRLVQSLMSVEAFKKVGTRLENPRPSCKDKEFNTNEYWECVVRHFVVTAHHVVATCRMGRRNDPNTVVDTSLRVKGVNRLRVVDASVMPDVPSGNTHSPTIMVAEKAADMIKRSHIY